MDHPPCWRDGEPCPNACAYQLYRRTVWNQTPLYGPWSGWRLAGQHLVSPHGDRIAPYLLDRWMWRHSVMFR